MPSDHPSIVRFAPPSSVSARLKDCLPDIFQRWEGRVREELPAARDKDSQTLRNSLPEFVEQLAEELASPETVKKASRATDFARSHAVQRGQLSGYSVDLVITEYRLLEELIFEVLEEEAPLSAEKRNRIIQAMGEGMRESSREFVRLQQESLAKSEEKYRLLVESATDFGMLLLDTEGCITGWNPGAECITGWTEEEMLGLTCKRLFTPEDQARGAREREIETARREGRAEDERWHMRQDGSRFFASGVMTKLSDENGHFVGYAKVLRDVTDRKRLQDELAEKVHQLNEADRAKDEFLAMLGHELRNPLGAISNATHLLQTRTAQHQELQRPVELLSRQTAHMNHLVNDLLDVARITQGKIELKRERVDMNAVAAAVLHQLQPQIHAKGLRFRLATDEAVMVMGDPVRLEQIVSNLLTNAIKYTEEGSIYVSVGEKDGHAIVEVRDMGIGITQDLLPRIFNLFAQGSTGLERSQGGLGIGLTLVRRLVEMHGGRIEAASAGPGKGSTFTVTLPLLEERGAPAPEEVAAISPGERSLQVLIVDDNMDAAEILAEILESWGYTATTVHDGPGGVESALDQQPDVLLLDIGLPGMDGYEVARRLREAPEMDGTVYIALTGYGQEHDKLRTREAGFHYHLVKPVDINALQSVLAKVAKGR